MTDYSELKRLAEEMVGEKNCFLHDEVQVVRMARGGEILALIAENGALRKDYAQAWEKAQALQSECDEFVKDAERYRWLMSPAVYNGTLGIADGWIDFEFKDEAEQAIDAAMALEAAGD